MKGTPTSKDKQNPLKYQAKKVPKQTPLKDLDMEKRVNYAINGPINKGGKYGCITLSDDWEIRRIELGWLDDKPWWKDSSSVKNRFYYDFDGHDPPEVLGVDKHSPHFMNLCGICWNGRYMHWYSTEVKNKRRSRNKNGDLVTKHHYEHHIIDAKLVVKTFEEEVLPWAQAMGIKMLICDNDSKFHTKMLVELCKRNGIEMYPGGGKKPWDREVNGYPPRSHDCMPCETEFANCFEEAQLDVDRREKNRRQKRTMKMWKNAIPYTWENRGLVVLRKLINKQPKIMQTIIEHDGAQTTY